MKTHQGNEGAMLINLMVSLAIMLVLISVSIPNFRRYQTSLRFNDTSRALVANLRYAQQLAITEQKTYGVLLNESIDSYAVVRYEEGTGTTTIKTVTLPYDVSFGTIAGFPYNFIRYNSYGSVSNSGSIEMLNSGGESQTVEIKPSGYVDY